jgi:hypothetical protein
MPSSDFFFYTPNNCSLSQINCDLDNLPIFKTFAFFSSWWIFSTIMPTITHCIFAIIGKSLLPLFRFVYNSNQNISFYCFDNDDFENVSCIIRNDLVKNELSPTLIFSNVFNLAIGSWIYYWKFIRERLLKISNI